jgi:hypothetical protein
LQGTITEGLYCKYLGAMEGCSKRREARNWHAVRAFFDSAYRDKQKFGNLTKASSFRDRIA